MKRTMNKLLMSAAVAFLAAMFCGPAKADLIGGGYVVTNVLTSWVTNWDALPGIPPQYVSIPSGSLGSTTQPQGQPSAGGGATDTVLAETFTPAVPFTLRGIAILATVSAAGTVSMHLFDVTTNLTSNNGNIYNGSGATYTPTNTPDLLGSGNGLSFSTTAAGAQQWFFGLANGPGSNDEIQLLTNHTYSLEFWTAVSTGGALIWYRLPGASPNDPGGQMMAGHDNATNLARTSISTAGLAGGAPRTGAMALYSTNFINPGPTTNTITALLDPVPASFGPPTVWPYTAGIAVPDSGAVTPVPVSPDSVIGQTFLATRDFRLRNFYIACGGGTNSGLYTLVLNDLGITAPGSPLNPGSYVNLLAHPDSLFPQYWSFTPRDLTNRIVKFKLSAGDQVTLTNGHSYFLGFSYVPNSGSNDLNWIGNTTAIGSYPNGDAYKGSATSVATLPGGVSDFLMAVDVLNPNLVVGVTNAPLAGSWPGSPAIAYTTPDPLVQPVPEGVSSGRALSMSFIATSNFNLGGIALRQRGIGSSNVLFNLEIYDVTNTFFTVTNTVEKWPRNFQPNLDTSPKGVPIFGTNLNFYYTADVAGTGTDDQFLILTIGNPAYQVLLQSNHNYLVEITADTLGQNANTDGLFQWIRDIGEGNFQIQLFPDLNDGSQFDGLRTNAFSGGAAFNVLPRALSRFFADPETVAGMVAGNPRFFIMAVYAAPPAPPTITLTDVDYNGGAPIITWNSTLGATYTVYRTNNVAAPGSTWPAIVTGHPPGGAAGGSTSFTDTTAGGTSGFYRVSSP